MLRGIAVRRSTDTMALRRCLSEMDWRPPPRNWFYRVQIGLQSPEGATTHGVLRRFSDFLKLSSDLQQSFRNKKLPPAPPKGLPRKKNRTLLEEQDSSQRRCSLEDWMAKVLSDIDFSRSAPVACFLELEAVARSAFRESNHHIANVNLSCNSSSSSEPVSSQTEVFVVAGTSASSSNYNNGSSYETSEIRPDLHVKDYCSEFDTGNPISDNSFAGLTKGTIKEAFSEDNNSTLSKEFSEGKEEKYLQKSFDGRTNLDQIPVRPSYALSHHHDSVGNSSSATPISTSLDVHQDDGTSSKCSESVATSEAIDTLASSDCKSSPDTLVVLPLDEQKKTNRVLNTMQQRLVTSKTDIQDLIARLNQELAVGKYLTAKVKDLETELESRKQIGTENLKQAISTEQERLTQMQWDMEELTRKCMEMEFRLKAEQDEKAHAEATKTSIVKENEALRQELASARQQLKTLQKYQEEADLRSKSDVKLLVKEVKSFRGSQSELQQELERVSKERMEFETRLEKERTKREYVNAANRRLLHECEILRNQLEECSVNFLVEQENKPKMDSPPNDAFDILATSENRIGLLLKEAQLLAQDVATSVTSSSLESDNLMTADDELRKMLASVFIDNAILRKQANSLIRCALNMTDASPNNS